MTPPPRRGAPSGGQVEGLEMWPELEVVTKQSSFSQCLFDDGRVWLAVPRSRGAEFTLLS